MKSLLQKYFFNEYPRYIIDSICELETEVENHSFTAWSFANKNYAVSAFWADEYNCKEDFGQPISHPIFDLSSLSKPLFINLFLMLEQGKNYFDFVSISLNSLINPKDQLPISLRQFIKKNPDLSLDSFLSHKTGLMPWSWMGQRSALKIINFIMDNKISDNKNEVYSDLNYFLLSRIIEIIPMNGNNFFTCKNLINKINLNLKTCFSHAAIQPTKKSIPFFPYRLENKSFNDEAPDFGFVHDTNSNMFSSLGKNNIVSGHAGLFGSISDIIKAIFYLNNSGILDKFSKTKQERTSRFIFGYDTASSPDSSAGIKRFSENQNKIFGHLGYTGTAFWIHSERKEFQILLTNRTSSRKDSQETPCPRIFIVEDLQKNEKNFFVNDGGLISKKTPTEINDLSDYFFNKKKIIWDKSYIKNIKSLKDMLSIRKKIGLNLWDI